MNESNFLTEAQAAKKRSRRFRRRLRNRLALAISIGLIISYSFDIGLDRSSESFDNSNSRGLANSDPLRQATNLQVTTYGEDGQRQLSVITDSAKFGNVYSLSMPDRIKDAVVPAAIENDDDGMEFSDIEQVEAEPPSTALYDSGGITVSPLLQSSFATLEPVSVFAFDGDNITATLSANNALLDGMEETLWLDGAVTANNLIDNSTMATEQISMHTKTRQFAGSEPVTLNFENSVTRAVGIQGTFVDRRWSLLSSVNTVIDPQGAADSASAAPE